jgi:hypothetical protein
MLKLEMEEIFNMMKSNNVLPDPSTFPELIEAYGMRDINKFSRSCMKWPKIRTKPTFGLSIRSLHLKETLRKLVK